MYIELHAASAFSFLEGASLPETLVERAAALGYPALALLDADGVYGAPRFHKAAKQAGIKAIIGAELTIGPRNTGSGSRRTPQTANPRTSNPGSRDPNPEFRIPHPESRIPNAWRLPVLVESQTGYQNLCRLVTRMKMRGCERGEARW